MADNLNDFKIKAAYGDFDRIKQNPYSSKVTSKDIMGCIAYLKISGYLFSKNLGLEKNKKLNLKLYKQILDLPRLTTLVNPDQLLHFLQKAIEKKGTININALHKSALLYLLLIITGDENSFFNATFFPFGPKVIFTALDSFSTPLKIASLASLPYNIFFIIN